MSGRSLDELDYYALLGVPRDARADAIRAAFHRFAARAHPDRHIGAPTHRAATHAYRRGAEAYRVLMNPEKRAHYDAQLELGATRYSAPARGRSEGRDAAKGELAGLTPEALRFVREAERAAEEGNLKMARFHLSLAERRAGEHPRVVAARESLSRLEEGRAG